MPATTATPSDAPFAVNDRTYRPPAQALAVVCIDGCAESYLTIAMARGRLPRIREMAGRGYWGTARCALPSFTNVNNASIVTGVPPSVTGISGNFFIDPGTGAEVMMSSPDYVRCETILAVASRAGRKVAFVTAKDKLRSLLSRGLEGIAFSAEKADQARQASHGIADVETLVGQPTPPIYSAEASLFVLQAGAALVEHGLADFLYLSLTDYVQHIYAPDTDEALDFYAAIDDEIGHLLDLGVRVGLTADHGMNSKTTPDGHPNVIYLESQLGEAFGPGHTVICPITDPYVVHHGGLGSMVTVHLADPAQTREIAQAVLAIDGVTEVLDRKTAVAKLDLPADRVGDLIVMSGRHVVIGRTPDHHDLSHLRGPLRSHGGRYEEMVPLIFAGPLTAEYTAKAAGDPRNFEVFDYICNGVGS